MKSGGYFTHHLTFDARRAAVWRQIVAYLDPWLKSTQKHVVEIAAGHCACINAISARERTAIDIDPVVQAYAASGVRAVLHDVRDRWPIREADIIVASNFFEHLTDDECERVLSHARESSSPDALLCVMQPNFKYSWKEYFDDYTHKRIYTHISFTAVLKQYGWDVVHAEPRFLPYSFKSAPSILPHWVYPFLVKLYLRLPWKPYAGQMLIIAKKSELS